MLQTFKTKDSGIFRFILNRMGEGYSIPHLLTYLRHNGKSSEYLYKSGYNHKILN